jgi:hypothetical protein
MMTGDTALIPNMEFAKLATDERVKRSANALEANNIHVIIVKDGIEA